MTEVRGVILLYHRVHNASPDPQLLCVSPEHFAEHADVLRRRARVVRLPELLGDGSARTPEAQPRAAITFDDGYADNLVSALPVLARFDCPATVFVCRAEQDQGAPFWWDEVEALVLCGRLRRPDVRLNAPDQRVTWKPTSAGAAHGPCTLRNASPQLTIEGTATALYESVCCMIKSARLPERQYLLSQLRGAFAPVPDAGERYRRLSDDDLVALHDSGLVEIGAHTQTHPVLSTLSAREQYEEIAGSKRAVEQVMGGRVCSFSYPFGTRRDYNAATLAEVRRAGFDRACANVTGRVTAATDRVQVPRFIVRDWDGDTFESHLDAWLAA